MSGLERLKEMHEAAIRLRRAADAAALERDRAVAEVLTSGEARGRDVAEVLGLSTQRVYDMANKARRIYAQQDSPRQRG
ncbi:hypothetical protein AB0M33_02560 [Micrococcus luteus]|uniref:hypothetical protein n=1 Tax=Actinomycetes TaxID=1760 RepID=UPI0033289DC6